MMEKKNEQRKVLVGLSGGVDSAVTLALLRKNGYCVEAAFLSLQDNQGRADKSLLDAGKICEVLNVPLHIIDARLKFKKTVIEYFLDEYSKGRTPNPCIFCNEQLKFKLLLKTAQKLKINLISTGHYAQIKKQEVGDEKQGENKKIYYQLLEAKDEKKDQSYFLYRLKQKQLEKILLPLGAYTKKEVRELAGEFNLPVFDKQESQDVCFISNNNLENFLAKQIKLKKGKIIDTDGNVVGEHKSLALYTPGQRKGINIGGVGPYFVVGKNLKKNILIVTNNQKHPLLFQTKINLKQVSWTSDCPELPLAVLARIRYHKSLERATIKLAENKKKYILEFEKSQRAVSKGQSAVFYGKNGEVLGGGIIN